MPVTPVNSSTSPAAQAVQQPKPQQQAQKPEQPKPEQQQQAQKPEQPKPVVNAQGQTTGRVVNATA